MKKILQVCGISVLALLFLSVPLLSAQIHKVEAAGYQAPIHPATYHYGYRYYQPVNDKKKPSSRQCYWYYSNGSYVYVCR